MLSVHLKRKITIISVLALFILAGLYSLWIAINNWFIEYHFLFQSPVQISFYKPVQVVKNEWLRPTIIEVVNELPELKNLTSIEKYICDKWGPYNCRLAVAVIKTEGLSYDKDGNVIPDRFHIEKDGTVSIGITQINSVNWDLGGCSLQEIADPFKAVDCGYRIWDRADGEEGNGEGAFTPWGSFTDGNFRRAL